MDSKPTSARLVFAAAILLAAAAALALRLPHLERRPMHTDEAVHAVKFGILFDTGEYVYNPREYHGPTLYYASLPFVWLSGARSFADIRSEIPIRLVTVAFGVGLILLLPLAADGIGRHASEVAAILTAVSPAMFFYSRYYIQEMPLVFFTFGLIACGWRYARSKRMAWAMAAGACAGLMHATKETAVLAWGAMAASLALTLLWRRLGKSDLPEAAVQSVAGNPARIKAWHIVLSVAAAVAVSVLLMSDFFRNPKAIPDSVRAYSFYFGRGLADMGSASAVFHKHPWYFYLHMLLFFRLGAGPWWSEASIVALALVGIAVALLAKKTPVVGANASFLRFLAIYTLVMTAVYSAIPYKTPWCMMDFLHGMILMAGVGAAAIWQWLSTIGNRQSPIASRQSPVANRRSAISYQLSAVFTFLFAAAVCHLVFQARRACFVFYADPRNPYVYAQTSTDIVRLAARAERLAQVAPQGYHTLVKVIAPEADYWPLPWYLRRFDRVGYWNDPPADADAALIVAKTAVAPALEARLHDKYQAEYYGLRPGELLVLYVQSDLWDKLISSKTPG